MMRGYAHLVIFDGVCNLCNASVNFIIRRDKRNLFRFTALQSDMGKRIMRGIKVPADFSGSVIYVEHGRVYFKSSAVLKILLALGGGYSLWYVLIVIPVFIRDFFYDIVAKYRYGWFGKSTVCRVPDEDQKGRFV
jgi:predicted DCC family thiol-disulfide oxidoreductase YuxK